jgi:hypothetical protein
MAKKIRKRLNAVQNEKKIRNDLVSFIQTFLIQSQDKIEFSPPVENHVNRFLSNDKPIFKINSEGKFSVNGTLGQPKFYYFEPANHKALLKIFADFNIPLRVHADLIWAFLNMSCAATQSTHIDSFNKELNREIDELIKAMDLLSEFESNKTQLQSLTLKFKQRDEIEIKGHVALQFFRDVLHNYKDIKEFETPKLIYDQFKQYGHPDMKYGHKNHSAHKQTYYAHVIFKYLRNELFRIEQVIINDRAKCIEEVKRLRRLYSHDRIYLFIGRLMVLSGLMKDTTDDLLKDRIKKKM